MTLFRSLHSRLSHAEQLKADVHTRTAAVLAGYAKEFGEAAAAELARDLQNGEDGPTQDAALAVLAERDPELLKLGEQVASVEEELAPVMDAVRVKAEDRLELLRQTASSAPIPASERDATDFQDAAEALLHEDADGGVGRFAYRRHETLPIENREAWEAALRFEAEAGQQPREDPLAGKSLEELEAMLPSDERGIARTGSPGVLVQTETVVDPDLEASLAQMRREIERGR